MTPQRVDNNAPKGIGTFGAMTATTLAIGLGVSGGYARPHQQFTGYRIVPTGAPSPIFSTATSGGGTETMADAALTQKVTDLGQQVGQLVTAVQTLVDRTPVPAVPRMTFGRWVQDNGATVSLVIAIVVGAFSFNDRLNHLDEKIGKLGDRIDVTLTKIDGDFRTLTDKIDALTTKVAVDEVKPNHP